MNRNDQDMSPEGPVSPGKGAGRGGTKLMAACGGVWLVLAVAGLGFLWRVENKPGEQLAAPGAWPAGSGIASSAGMANMVVFAHPRCPCTEAGMGEIERLLAETNGQARVHVIFYKPPGAPDEWAHTALWTRAAALPHADVRCDQDGAEAKRFGATTSGYVLLYDATGHLRYHGGITAERGHEGDNEGLSAMVAILRGEEPRVTSIPVLGCSFSGPTLESEKGNAQ